LKRTRYKTVEKKNIADVVEAILGAAFVKEY